MQTKNVDAKKVRRDSFPVEGVNSADLAEKVSGSMGMELIFRERFFASQ